MSREIFLLAYPQRNTPAHWSIFIPAANSVSTGKVIHVVGNPFIGYRLQFKRNYDTTKTNRTFHKILLGHVSNDCVRDVEGNGVTTDTEDHDILEARAKLVQPPGVSPSPLDRSVGKRCQHWLQDYVQLLVGEGLLPQSAITELNRAPKA
ncbi:hypothetical protein DTO271G3_6885 [Paecilomyces variotii]|nr:hypothetical protein DTO271G3_6885 [Paecilomyces variotii]